MTRRRFTITTDITTKPREFDLFIYDTLGTMQGAAKKWAKVAQPDDSDFSDTAAVVHGFQRFKYGPAGEEIESPTVAIVRLVKDRLTPHIVSHEVAHLAQHIYGLDYDDGLPVEEHMHSGNENFAFLYSELFATVWSITERVRSGDDQS